MVCLTASIDLSASLTLKLCFPFHPQPGPGLPRDYSGVTFSATRAGPLDDGAASFRRFWVPSAVLNPLALSPLGPFFALVLACVAAHRGGCPSVRLLCPVHHATTRSRHAVSVARRALYPLLILKRLGLFANVDLIYAFRQWPRVITAGVRHSRR